MVCATGGDGVAHGRSGAIGTGSFGQEGIVALHGPIAFESSQTPVVQVPKERRSMTPLSSHLKY